MRASLLSAAISALLLAGSDALACPSMDSYSFVVLRAPPAATTSETVVARVQVIGLVRRDGGDDSRYARVRVVEAVRGTRRGAEFVIGTEQRTMCVQRFWRDSIGQRGHVAGVIDPATGEFRGSWRRGRRVE